MYGRMCVSFAAKWWSQGGRGSVILVHTFIAEFHNPIHTLGITFGPRLLVLLNE